MPILAIKSSYAIFTVILFMPCHDIVLRIRKHVDLCIATTEYNVQYDGTDY